MIKEFVFKSNNFDFIRLVAAFQVLFLHSVRHLELSVNKQFVDIVSIFPGVPIFFVLSGFLISASYENSCGVMQYLKNRFLRIYPALWVCFIFSVLSILVFYKVDLDFSEFMVWVVAQVTFFQFYNPDFLRDYGVGVINGSLWTVSVELQFYIALPVLYYSVRALRRCFGNSKLFFVVMVFAFSVLVIANYMNNVVGFEDKTFLEKVFSVSLIPYLYMFVFGVFVQRGIVRFHHLLKGKVLVWAFAYFATVLVCDYFGFVFSGNDISFVPFIVLSLFVFSLGYSFDGSLGRLLRGRDVSYGVYIYHMIFVNIFVQLGLVGSYLSLFLVVMFVLLSSVISWVYVEKPFLRLKKRSILTGEPVTYG